MWQFKDVLFKDLKKKKKSSIDAPLISEPFEYRHRIRLTVKNEKIGFLKSGSNEIVEIDHCSITHPLIQKQIRLSRDASILKLHSLQSVEWLVDDNQQIAIRLILKKAPSQAKLTQAIDWLRQNEVHNYRFEFTQNVIEGGKQLEQIHEDLSYQYLPGQFTQVNSNVNQLMLKQAQDWILQCFESDNIKEAKALDLFCGMGNFTLLLAKYFKQTIGIESSSDSIQCAKQNAQENQKRIELNELKFIEQDLFANNWGQAIARHQFDLVVLDPPRAGAKQICTDIEQLSSQYLLYISCNQSTLLRDTILLQERGYAIERANIMDMFAQTHHIETMVLFKKQ